MKTVLVTGGLGYIGSHTCIELLRKNYNIIIIDSFVNNSIDSISQIKNLIRKEYKIFDLSITLKKGDIRDELFLDNVFIEAKNQNNKIDVVIHFAGLKSVNESIKKSLEYWDVNVGGTLALLNAMQKNDCRTIVFSSSATVYRHKINKQISEESELMPINPYGRTKQVIEMILKDKFNEKCNDWRIINLRYFNPVGAHESGLIGENPKINPTNLFPVIMNKMSLSERIPVFGNDWPTKDGTCIRDYIHVVDLAKAHLASLEFLIDKRSIFLSLNIGTGIGISVMEVINTFSKISNCKIQYYFDRRRGGDAPYVVADNRLALATLNWKPKKKILDMCKDTWNWHKKMIKT